MRHRRRHAAALPSLLITMTTAGLLTLGGCRAEERPLVDSTAAASGVAAGGTTASRAESARGATATPTPRPPLDPARDADQDFLRHMLDHHETVLALTHAQMMDPAGHAAHGGASDPTAMDAKLDAEKMEMLALLSRVYGEDYSPRASEAPGPVASAPASGTSPSAAEQDHGDELARALATQLRAGAALAERYSPRLTRPAVRDLARRLRASQLELVRQMEPPATR